MLVSGPVWQFASASTCRATIGHFVQGMAARSEVFEAYWTMGGPGDRSTARACRSAPLVGPIGRFARLACRGAPNGESRSLRLARPGAAWDEPLQSPVPELHVTTHLTLGHEEAQTFGHLESVKKPQVVRFAASLAPVGPLQRAQASAVYAALATLEQCAPGGVAWFNHEVFRYGDGDDAARRVLFSTEDLTLEDVARHERLGQGPFAP